MFISNNALNDKHNFLLPMKKKKKEQRVKFGTKPFHSDHRNVLPGSDLPSNPSSTTPKTLH